VRELLARPLRRGAKRDDDDVEAGVVPGLDAPLEDGRGVAPAGSVLEVGRECTLHDGAGGARAVGPVEARVWPGPEVRSRGASKLRPR
jgi:hypothetical protein